MLCFFLNRAIFFAFFLLVLKRDNIVSLIVVLLLSNNYLYLSPWLKIFIANNLTTLNRSINSTLTLRVRVLDMKKKKNVTRAWPASGARGRLINSILVYASSLFVIVLFVKYWLIDRWRNLPNPSSPSPSLLKPRVRPRYLGIQVVCWFVCFFFN